jgi:hypothetical protein
MRRLIPRALVLILVVVVAGCGRLGGSPGADDDSPGPGVDARKIAIYEVAIRSLAGTEGWFDPVLIDERICAEVGDPMTKIQTACESRFTDDEQVALLSSLTDLSGVRFVAHADDVTHRIFEGELKGAGLIGVGPIVGDGNQVEVPGKSYCGGLCGHWMTLVVENGDEGWSVTGTTGPVAIS